MVCFKQKLSYKNVSSPFIGFIGLPVRNGGMVGHTPLDFMVPSKCCEPACVLGPSGISDYVLLFDYYVNLTSN